MVAVSRCWGSLAIVATGALGARFARRKKVALESEKAKDCFSMYDGMPLLHLQPCTTEQAGSIFSQLEASGCTVLDDDFEYSKNCDDVEVVCSKQMAAELEKGHVATVVSPDAGAHWRQTSGPTVAFTGGLSAASTFYTAYRDADAQAAQVEALVQASGGIATLETVGQSLEGRNMKIVRFRGEGYTAGGPRVFVTYNIHAREWITGMSGVYQVEHLIERIRQEPSYLAGTEVVLMPMSNPDGFRYSTTSSRMHRKNMRRNSGSSCRGVDLNRNWDAHWASGGSSGSPCSDTYHGTRAMSEPETNVIAQVMNAAQNTVYIDVHAFSQLIISSYGYTTRNNPRSAEYRQLGRQIQSAIRSVGGSTWREGPIAQVLYAASGSTVDYADARGALGICFELRPSSSGGGGFAPPARDILPGARESFAGIMTVIDYARGSAPTPTPPSPTPTPTPTPTPPSPTPPSPTPPTGGCVQEKDCSVSAWCNSPLEEWCRQNAAACPAPYCKRT